MSNKITLRTGRAANFGKPVVCSQGTIVFDMEGRASVSEEIAEFMVSNFPKNYYLEGEETPDTKVSENPIDPSKDASVRDFARNLARTNMAESNAKARGEQSFLSDDQIATASTPETGLVDAKGAEIKKSAVDKLDLSTDVREELLENKMSDLRAVCVEAEGISKSEWAKLKKKEALVDFIIEKGIVK